MKQRKRAVTIILTLALGLGVWTAAVSFSPTLASFNDGDVLSASELNSLLNDNLNAISNAVSGLDSDKLSTAGGTITGRTDIEGDASTSGTGDPNTLFRVRNTAANGGAAAVFESDNDGNIGAVNIKQNGTGPALSLKSLGGGPFISGAFDSAPTFVVEADGTIRIGDLQNSSNPSLVLDATEGTVTNHLGSGLPLAFGGVSELGDIRSGTSNWTLDTSGLDYLISIDGVSYNSADFTTVVTPNSLNVVSARTTALSGDVVVELFDADGVQVDGNFHFVTFQPGN